MKNLIKILIPFLFFVAIACGEKEDITPGLDGDTGYVAEYTEETIFIDEDNAAGTIISSDTASQTYVLNATKFTKEPSKGEVILVAGELMRKVVSVSEKGGNYEVVTEDAALTDVIENGTLAWDITPEWSEVAAVKVDGEDMGNLRNIRGGALEFSITRSDVEHKVRIEPMLSDGKINACKMKILMVKKVGGSANVAFSAEGIVKLPKQKTSISIADSKLQSFKADNEGISADIELSMAAAGGKSGAHSLKLPGVALSIPIKFIPTPGGPIPLPIPVSIDIGIQFVSQLTIPDAKSSATAKSNISISADAGFEYKGTSVETKGSIGKDEITNGTFDSAANIGFPIDVQFGVAFPRVGLKIAGQELAYVHTGFTTGSKLTWGPLCKSGYVKMVVEGGYALKVLGQTVSESKKVFAESNKEAKGDNCS